MRGWAVVVGSSAFLLVLAGCYPEYQPENHGVGDAVVHNVAEQVVNPEPNKTTVPPTLDGRRAADAYYRYREDRVIQPVVTSTSGLTGTSGGAAAPGGGAGMATSAQ